MPIGGYGGEHVINKVLLSSLQRGYNIVLISIAILEYFAISKWVGGFLFIPGIPYFNKSLIPIMLVDISIRNLLSSKRDRD